MAKAKADTTGPARSKEQRAAFDAMIKRATPELQALATAARKLVASVMPGCIEIVWPAQGIASWGTGPKKGSGKSMRNTKLRVLSDLERPELRALIERASVHRVPAL